MSEKIYGLDIGTNSIKIHQKGTGVVVHQKNMIAMVKKNEPLLRAAIDIPAGGVFHPYSASTLNSAPEAKSAPFWLDKAVKRR